MTKTARVILCEMPSTHPIWGNEKTGVMHSMVELDHDCHLVIDYLGKRYSIVVKAGFRFDGASIPSLFWAVVGSPFDPRNLVFSCFHDALYETEAVSRPMCDVFMLAIMDYECISKWKAKGMYRAVRMFGGNTWRGHTQKSIDGAKRYFDIVIHDLINPEFVGTAIGAAV